MCVYILIYIYIYIYMAVSISSLCLIADTTPRRPKGIRNGGGRLLKLMKVRLTGIIYIYIYNNIYI